MVCRNCNAELENGTIVCPYCGYNHSQITQNNGQQYFNQGFNQQQNQSMNYENYNPYSTQQYNQPKKKNKGCLIAIIILIILGIILSTFLFVSGIVLTTIGNFITEELPTEIEEVMTEIELEETEDIYDFKDSDYNEVLDGDIFDKKNEEILDEEYIGEFISETFRTASIAQKADTIHWLLIAKLNDISSTENLELILNEDTKSLKELKQLKEEYGFINTYESQHLETIKELILKDIDNEIFLLEKYLKVSEEIRNGDQSGVEQFYKDEELFKQKDLNLEGVYNILINAGETFNLDAETVAKYMMQNVADIRIPEF